MSWTIQNFPLPSDAELQGIVAYVNENYLEYRQAKADTYTYGWGALNGDTESLLRYSQALATIERIQGEYNALANSDIVWNDGTTSFGITYLQYVVNLDNYLAFQEFGVKFGYGTTGDDTDTLGAGWNNYVINYYGGNDSVTVASGTHRVLVNLGDGNDAFTGSDGSDGVLGGAGNDILRGGGNVDVLDGGLGDDKLFGDAGDDLLYGSVGNDLLSGGIGSDFMEGGLGNDIYVVDNTGDIVVEALNAGADTVQSSITYTLGANVENLTLTGTAAINGTGNELNNVLTGNSAVNTLTGGLGNDTYVIGAGDIVVEALNAGADTVQSSITYTLGANVENLTLTGTAAINGTGNELNNVLTGNSAVNTLTGGLGNDTYVIGAGDIVVEALNAGTDTVQSSITYTLGANVENLTLTGTAAINGTGNELNNVLTGNSAVNTLTGGLGNDTYVIGAGDIVVEALNAGTDTVQSSITYTLGANVENLTLTGTAAINGTGNTLNNTITGNGAANTLNGGDGNDSLIGGSGVDSLIGGNGSDNLNGGAGIDTLTGISTADTTLGRGSIDVLTGGTENDFFVLGNASGVFYTDSSTTTAGRSDFARITDFTAGDKIQLKGTSANYFLKTGDSVSGFSGTGLYRNDGTGTLSSAASLDTVDDFIALIQNPTSLPTLSLTNAEQFAFVV